MKCPNCSGQYGPKEMEIQHVCERCGNRQYAADEIGFTIDQIEAWVTYLRNIGEIAWVERNLRSPRYGLAAHARKKEDEG